MRPVKYEGTKERGVRIQNGRRRSARVAEQEFANRLREYRSIGDRQPDEARWEWAFAYDVDAPMVTPDLWMLETEEQQQKHLEHVKALGFKVTYDLLKTIKIDPN